MSSSVSRRKDMATAHSTNDLEHFVNCGVCFCEFDEETRKPKFLPCAHTVCLKCLQEICRLCSIVCPFCRKTFYSDTASLPNNSYALQMLKFKVEKEKLEEPGTQSLDCKTCGSIGEKDDTKKLASVLEKRQVVQRQLDVILKSITAVRDQVKEIQEENDFEIAQLISVIKMTRQTSISVPANLPIAASTSLFSLKPINSDFAQSLKNSYIFILRVSNLGSAIGEIRIRPTLTFHPKFVEELGKFCYKSPKAFSNIVDKAQAGVFISILMSHGLFICPNLETANQFTRISASKFGEVGIIREKNNVLAFSHSIFVPRWNFFLPLNPVNQQQKNIISSADAELFGHIIDSSIDSPVVRELSTSKKSERWRYSMTVESQLDC